MLRVRVHRVPFIAGCGLVMPISAAAQCAPAWTTLPLQLLPSGNPRVNVIAPFDDGRGAALYVGGRFTSAEGVTLNNIGKRTPQAWTALSGGVTGGSSVDLVAAMVVFDPDGPGPAGASLVVGGTFTQAGGQPAARIARWDGIAWHPLGSGVDVGLAVRALAVFDRDGAGPALPVLVAAGDFTTVGGVAAPSVAAWDGQAWSALGGDPGVSPRSLAVIDHDGAGPETPSLYAGGFPSAGLQLEALARFNGVSWELIGGLCWGGGLVPRINAMTVHDADGPGSGAEGMYVAGSFRVEGTECRNVARWTGEQWEPVGTCLGLVHDDELLTVGSFDPDGPGPAAPLLVAGGYLPFVTSPAPLAAWNGTVWTSLGYAAGASVNIRAVGSLEGGAGPRPATLLVGASDGPIARYGCAPCYANCDDSSAAPALNVGDYLCFMNHYAAADPYANCDQSTLAPALNVLDFVCFSNAFAAGCP